MRESLDNEHPSLSPVQHSNGGPAPSSAAFLARTSALLAGATLISRLLGLVREMLIARYYGATGQTDCFAFAIVVPELLRTLIISGAVASIFIPLMTETQKSGKSREAKELAGVMLTFIALVAIIVVLAGEIFAPQLVRLSELLKFSQGNLDPEKIALTVELVRIMLPIVIFVGLWGLLGGILNAFDNFHIPGLAPLAWNGAIIVLLIIFGSQGKIYHVAWAFVIGHAIQMLVHIPSLLRLGIRPIRIDWKHPMLIKFIQLAPAAVLAYASPAVNAFIGQGIALNLEESSASSLMYAFRIQQLPMSIFGVSVATALFPTLSRHATRGSRVDVVSSLASALRMTALAVLPAVVFFLILPEQTIGLIFERGKFTSDDTVRVAGALFWYSWAILPMSLLLLTARTFFSEKDTRTPAILGICTIVLYYIMAVTLSSHLGYTGLPMSNSLVAWIFLVVSIAILNRRYIRDASLLKSIGAHGPLQMLIACIIEAAALFGYSNLVGEVHGTWPLIGMLVGAMIIGAVVYLGILKLLGNPDLTMTLRHFLRRR